MKSSDAVKASQQPQMLVGRLGIPEQDELDAHEIVVPDEGAQPSGPRWFRHVPELEVIHHAPAGSFNRLDSRVLTASALNQRNKAPGTESNKQT
jgi:hypothetical protein